MSSSQYHVSANQSGESGVSSLQRSGLNISVGDTKSIVLALQALQQKIRALEQDRDYHQDQYERALHAHEAYKLDVERQMESERAAHRKREQELTELLRKALEEKKRLEGNYGNQQDDLASFRKELESMIEAEKQNAQNREKALEGEVEKLRGAVKDERSRYTALAQAIERLKRERQEVDDINEQLRLAMDDLLTQEEHKRRQRPATGGSARVQPRAGGQATGVGRRRSAAGRGRPQQPRATQRGGPTSAASAAAPPAPVSSRSHSDGRRYSYEDPTVNSILRDVRNISGEMPCHHDVHTGGDGEAASAAAAPRTTASQHNSMLGAPAPVTDRSSNGHEWRPRSASSRGRGGTPADRSQLAEAPAVAGVRTPERPRTAGAMPQVERQLKAELDDLQAQYRETIDRASAEDIPRDVLSAALNRISALIDHKLEQLRLIRGAQKELEAANTASTDPQSRDYYFDPRARPLSGDELGKATQRSMLVNELRSLLADSAAQ